jgi:hypothetical protein
VFDHVIALANRGASVFGATLLHDGVHRNWFARQVMSRNNAHGIFSNTRDSLDGLRSVVSERLSESSVEVVGCVGIFARARLICRRASRQGANHRPVSAAEPKVCGDGAAGYRGPRAPK